MSLIATWQVNAGGTTQATTQPGTTPQLCYQISTAGINGNVPAVVALDGSGNPLNVSSSGELQISGGGNSNAAVAAGTTTAAAVVKGTPGRLCTIVVTALGTAAVTIYDNASAASGTVLMVIPASTAAGHDLQARPPRPGQRDHCRQGQQQSGPHYRLLLRRVA